VTKPTIPKLRVLPDRWFQIENDRAIAAQPCAKLSPGRRRSERAKALRKTPERYRKSLKVSYQWLSTRMLTMS